MTTQPSPRYLGTSVHLYRLLLHLYPTNFRRAYGDEMAQLFHDLCYDAFRRHGRTGLLRLWLHTLSDWGRTVCDQHIEEIFHMSGKDWMIRIGAIAAVIGGLFGIYFAFQGPNYYGNYGWDHSIVFVVPSLFALGIGGGMAAYSDRLGAVGRGGLLTMSAGFVLQALGHVFDVIWPLIFLGPIIVAPIGAILLGRDVLRRGTLPVWWRYFPFLILAIALAAFGVEMYEEFLGNSTPDRGLQLAEALYSLAWIGLGAGLWIDHNKRPDDTPLAA